MQKAASALPGLPNDSGAPRHRTASDESRRQRHPPQLRALRPDHHRHRAAADDRDGHGRHLPRPDSRGDAAGGQHRRGPVGGARQHARAVRRNLPRAGQPRRPRPGRARRGERRGGSSRTPSSANIDGRPLRIVVQGLAWPEDRGEWIPLVAGRPLRQAHLRDDRRPVARLATRREGQAGQGHLQGGRPDERHGRVRAATAWLSSPCATPQAIQFDVPGEAVRLERQARRARAEAQDIGQVQPLLLERAVGPASGIPALGPARRSAPSWSRSSPAPIAAQVAATISTWPDVTVYSNQQQIDLLLAGMVDKAGGNSACSASCSSSSRPSSWR